MFIACSRALQGRFEPRTIGILDSWPPNLELWFKGSGVVKPARQADLSGEGRARYCLGCGAGLGEILMSVQMVLLPVFVLVGLTFFLMLWMVTARTQAR